MCICSTCFIDIWLWCTYIWKHITFVFPAAVNLVGVHVYLAVTMWQFMAPNLDQDQSDLLTKELQSLNFNKQFLFVFSECSNTNQIVDCNPSIQGELICRSIHSLRFNLESKETITFFSLSKVDWCRVTSSSFGFNKRECPLDPSQQWWSASLYQTCSFKYFSFD